MIIIIIVLLVSLVTGLYFTGYLPGTEIYKKRVIEYTKLIDLIKKLPTKKSYYNSSQIEDIKNYCTFLKSKSNENEKFVEYFTSFITELQRESGKSLLTITECSDTMLSILEIKENKEKLNYDKYIKLLKGLPAIEKDKTYTDSEMKKILKYVNFLGGGKNDALEKLLENSDIKDDILEKSSKSIIPYLSFLRHIALTKQLGYSKEGYNTLYNTAKQSRDPSNHIKLCSIFDDNLKKTALENLNIIDPDSYPIIDTNLLTCPPRSN